MFFFFLDISFKPIAETGWNKLKMIIFTVKSNLRTYYWVKSTNFRNFSMAVPKIRLLTVFTSNRLQKLVENKLKIIIFTVKSNLRTYYWVKSTNFRNFSMVFSENTFVDGSINWIFSQRRMIRINPLTLKQKLGTYLCGMGFSV